MLIDCDACSARGPACDDCVVGAFLATAPATAAPATPAAPATSATPATPATVGGITLDLDGVEQRAMRALADAGLVAPLRLVPVVRITPGVAGSPGMSARRDIA